jgi:hypothetical protein
MGRLAWRWGKRVHAAGASLMFITEMDALWLKAEWKAQTLDAEGDVEWSN